MYTHTPTHPFYNNCYVSICENIAFLYVTILLQDVDKLYKELGNPYGKFRVPHDKFNHLDFMWAIDVKDLLYDKILSLMTQFSH